MADGRLRVVCGPTAAGKSEIAYWLGERYGAAIVSADSRQIYRGFDIGTAKPTPGEAARVPHYGIDVVEPTTRYSAALWAADAEEWLTSARALKLVPVIVGGTGLYISALIKPLFRSPPIEPERRARLARELENRPLAELRRWCARLDPDRAHLGRAQILRAIETALLSGQRISDLHAAQHREKETGASAREASYLLVDPGPGLATRIGSRVERMLERGWLAEVQALMRAVPLDAPAWKASGYSALRALAAGEIDLSTARELVIIETRQYAKRQRTWFRHQLPPNAVTHVNPDDPAFREVAREWWEKAE